MPVETQFDSSNRSKSVDFVPTTTHVAEPGPQLVMFGILALQLGLLAVLINRFHLESRAFEQLSYLVFGGFAVHYWLPLRHRLSFFLCLSLASIVLVLGWQQAAWLVGSGLVLIGVCHLPVAFSIRVSLLAVLGGVLAAMRVGWVPSPLPFSIWPILASMFMFRLMVYVYDLRHQTAPFSFTRSLSYFFMLPNICFPLFPVVDYQSFCRNYYDGDRYRIYQVGVRWIFRGVVHLILYRIIYKNWSISLYEVENAGDLVHYCLWLFLLYLRVSGQFHIIVGMLHLFGFNLAETHHLYYLSSSFSDFWRRINIYWKDFMMKLFFYPIYFRLRGRGPVSALVLSTLIVFFLTWLLHAVQWFWLRGTFLVASHDILFWTVLAGLVIVNSLVELKYGRQRAIAAGDIPWSGALRLAIKTFATFTVICLLWSLWTSESLTAWLTLWQFAIVPPTPQGWLLIAATIAAIGGGALIVARNPRGFSWSQLSPLHEAAIRCVLILLLTALSITAINHRLGAPGQWIASARDIGLNRMEMAELERGYYEQLLDVNRFNGELWKLYMGRPPEWQESLVDAGLATPTNDLRIYELRPSANGNFKGIALRTNRWGMHDKEYSLDPPPDCYRIALLGASHVMAVGMERDQTFEALLEERLNREPIGAYKSCEILNFAVEGYRPPCQITVLQNKVLPFKPNAVFYVGHDGDVNRIGINLVIAARYGIAISDPFLADIIKRAGIESETPQPVKIQRLAPFGDEILSWVYHRMVAICNDHGILTSFRAVTDA